jgi:glycosyltransferase involved in cell wall biosynthesis
MKILIVSHYFEPSSGEAAARYSYLGRRFLEWGHEVTVLTPMPHYPKGEIDPAYRGKWSKVEMRDGMRVIYTWLWATKSERISRRLPSQLSFMLAAILRGLSIPKPDVILIEYQPMFTGIVGRFLADVKGVPYVLNVSDLWPDHLLSVGALKESSLVYRLARGMIDAGYRGAKRITTMSPRWTEKIIGYLGGESEKVETILRGADTERFKPLPASDVLAFQQKYGLDPAKKWISFLGTFATQYDFELCLDVSKALAHRKDLGFVFIGAGTQGAALKEGLAQGQYPNLTLIDWIAHEEMPLAWNASYLNYWALRDEPLYYGTVPAKLFEAMACGTPIAAAQGGAGAALIAEAGAGLTVKPADKAGLVSAIERLVDDAAFHEECRKNGRAYAEAHFRFEQVARTYEAALIRATKRNT